MCVRCRGGARGNFLRGGRRGRTQKNHTHTHTRWRPERGTDTEEPNKASRDGQSPKRSSKSSLFGLTPGKRRPTPGREPPHHSQHSLSSPPANLVTEGEILRATRGRRYLASSFAYMRATRVLLCSLMVRIGMPSATPATSTSAKLPTGSEWRSAVDPRTGRTYYWHRQTRETTWVLPEGVESAKASPSSGGGEHAERDRVTPVLINPEPRQMLMPPSTKLPLQARATQLAASARGRLASATSGLAALRSKMSDAEGEGVHWPSTIVKTLYLSSVFAVAAAVF